MKNYNKKSLISKDLIEKNIKRHKKEFCVKRVKVEFEGRKNVFIISKAGFTHINCK